jgi:hypothetical protein
MRKFFASSAVVIASLVVASPAFAFTHHPATRAERAQTRDLNLQQLAIAQGHAPGNMQASTGAPATTDNAASTDQNAAPAAPAAPDASAAPQSSQPAAPQTPQTNQQPANAPQTSPQQ